VEYSATSEIKKDFVRTVSNYISILSLSDNDFEKYCKQIGFSTYTEDNKCIMAFAGQVLSITDYYDALEKCGNELAEMWHGSQTSSGYKKLISELEEHSAGIKLDGAEIYNHLYEGYNYQFTLTSVIQNERIHEKLQITRAKKN
jgi:hypothetical protein